MAAREYPDPVEHRVPEARGGVAFGPIATGVVVAFGAMFLLSAVIGGTLAGLDYWEGLEAGEITQVGIGAGIALIVAQFFSYLWGGYTAGRMGRGAGVANGLLVPLAAIVVALVVIGIAAALGARANLNLPFTTTQLPLQDQTLLNWGIGFSIASLVVMFLGGAIGGMLGTRWHSKLERHAYDTERAYETEPAYAADRGDEPDRRPADERAARDRETPAAAPPPPASGEGVHYEAEGTRTRRTDAGNGRDREKEIDLTEERSRGETRR